MTAIGGYFELELTNNKTIFHDEAMAVNTGRNALEYILMAIKKCRKIYLPYYTCDVLLQPIKRLNYNFDFYEINENLMPKLDALDNNEVLLYINYFGIMDKKLNSVIKKYKNVIIDNSQAFFSKPLKGIPSFYSPRKFFGLPDGGFAYPNRKIKIQLKRDKSIGRFEHLLKRREDGPEAGFKMFKINDNKLNNLPLKGMSVITESILRNVNYTEVLKKRNVNFLNLHRYFIKLNELSPLIEEENINGPMVYPFLRRGNKNLKQILVRNKIFVGTYWPNVYNYASKGSWECYLADNLIPLPIDQRYHRKEMNVIKSFLSDYVKHK